MWEVCVQSLWLLGLSFITDEALGALGNGASTPILCVVRCRCLDWQSLCVEAEIKTAHIPKILLFIFVLMDSRKASRFMGSVSSLLFWPNKILAVLHQSRGQVSITMDEVLQPKQCWRAKGCAMSTGVTESSSFQPIVEGTWICPWLQHMSWTLLLGWTTVEAWRNN